MTDSLQHECGLAFIRLRQPLDYYQAKYNDPLWGLRRLYLLAEKQHNRGQDGAGVAAVKLNRTIGQPYIAHDRLTEPSPPWQHLTRRLETQLQHLQQLYPQSTFDANWYYQHFPYAGEILLAHLRYGTYGVNGLENCHPVVRQSSIPSRCLLAAGNFNLTNVQEQTQLLSRQGKHSAQQADTLTVLELIASALDHALDQRVMDYYQAHPNDSNPVDAQQWAIEELPLQNLLGETAQTWDGGYVIAGIIGHGHSFIIRDPNGIRPAFYYIDDEVIAVASERPALITTFGCPISAVHELPAGNILIAPRAGEAQIHAFSANQPKMSCSFERIYFSRGSDHEIYNERKALGRLLAPPVLDAIDHNLSDTVFCYIPNTALVSFRGLVEALDEHLNAHKAQQISTLDAPNDPIAIKGILAQRIRVEQAVNKDTQMRTFIADSAARLSLAQHVYDVTYGSIRPGVDSLVCIDDSIVRGTTLRESLLRMISRLEPNSIVVVSSCPQIRYPDCYGIDMSQMEKFVAFQAAIHLLRQRNQSELIDTVYHSCKEMEANGTLSSENLVQQIYAPFSAEELSDIIAQLLTFEGLNCPLKIVYQSVENLQQALPHHRGYWYFDGNYPTPGGNAVANRAYINFYEQRTSRAY
jgi:amidophosphoribosyltransferase